MFLYPLRAARNNAQSLLHARRRQWNTRWHGVALCALGGAILMLFLCLAPPNTRSRVTKPFAQIGVAFLHVEVNGTGRGAGGFGDNTRSSHVSVSCAPFDAACLANSVALSISQNVIDAFQPLTTGILSDPADIVIQTPPRDSYQDPTVMALNGLFVKTVDVALACLLLIGGYTVMVGPAVYTRSSLTELLPRAVLVVLAVQINLTFLGTGIDLENTLSLSVYHAAQVQSFANLFTGFLTFDPSTGLLVILGTIVLLILGLALLLQMIARIALVALLIAVAPLGLACLILPQTVRWGRLWLMAFSTAVFVQFLQITALGLGIAFLTSIDTAGFLHLGTQLARIFLTIGTLSVVLKIPSLLQRGILQPMMEASQQNSTTSREDHAVSGDAMDGSSGESDWEGSFGQGMSGGWGGDSTFGGDAFGGDMFGGSTMMEGQMMTDANGELLLTLLA